MRKYFPLILLILASLSTVVHAQTHLISSSESWKYIDDGSNQGINWRERKFDDSGWSEGNSELGYGDGDEATVVNFGTDPNNKFITTYFRKSFSVKNPSAFAGLNLRLLRDDGAIVYLNGTEVLRSNMPSGSIDFQTLASEGISGVDEFTYTETAIDLNLLTPGSNVIAVEVHQIAPVSTDISFNLELIGESEITVIRGPYLQMSNATEMTIRWRTSIPTNSRVRFGIQQGSLNNFLVSTNHTTEHELRLGNLSPNTRYYYAVGSTAGDLAGDDEYHFFYTSGLNTPKSAFRAWVVGDSGTANADARAVRDAYLNFGGSTYTNLILMLGDNAYPSGTDTEYQSAVFDMYPTILRQTPVWATIGNHDTDQSSTPPASLPYFQMFTLPTAAESGGTASGTEKYYSFDYGNAHFVSLDSMSSDRTAGGAMLTWLQNDLSQNTKPWVIAFWHHPPYSKGSHDSDSESRLIDMRENALPILESWGVDLVLSGHSHSYERSFFIDGHYGDSTTFIELMKKAPGGGRQDQSGAYTKSALSPNLPNEGAVYAVAGSSGKLTASNLGHPAMFVSLPVLGSMVLDFDNGRLDAKFLQADGKIGDYFTILKGENQTTIPLVPIGLSAFGVSTSSISLNWIDTSDNESGFKIERCRRPLCNDFTEVAAVGANVTSFSDHGLIADTTYKYRVRSFNPAGPSTYSAVTRDRTLKR